MKPVLEVTGPMIEAQIAETFIINKLTCKRYWPPRRPAACGLAKGVW